MRFHQVIGTGTALAADTTHDFTVPGYAIGAIFYLDLSAVTGVGPTIDVKLQFRDIQGAEFIDLDSGALLQLATADTQALLQVYPGITTDTTGAVRATNAMLGQQMRAVVDIATAAGQTYTYTLSVDWFGPN